jgi:hypothetical protein
MNQETKWRSVNVFAQRNKMYLKKQKAVPESCLLNSWVRDPGRIDRSSHHGACYIYSVDQPDLTAIRAPFHVVGN